MVGRDRKWRIMAPKTSALSSKMPMPPGDMGSQATGSRVVARRGAARQPVASPAVMLNSKPRSVLLPEIVAEAIWAIDAITAAIPIARSSRAPDLCRPAAVKRLYRKMAKSTVPHNPTLDSNAAIKLEARTVPSPAPKVAVSTNEIKRQSVPGGAFFARLRLEFVCEGSAHEVRHRIPRIRYQHECNDRAGNHEQCDDQESQHRGSWPGR